MRIGIDARFHGPVGKGLGRYTQKLIENLEKIALQSEADSGGKFKHEYFIFLRKNNFDDYKPRNKNFKKVLADYHWYTLAEQLLFPRLLKKYHLDLVHLPHFNVPLLYRKKFVVTIHDLILLHFPTRRSSRLNPLLYKIKFLAYKMVIKNAIIKAEKIITVSNFTKNDILHNYPKVSGEKIKVTYEACEDFCMLSPNKDDEILKRYGIIKRYLLYVGNAYPHKNLERLVVAFNNLNQKIPNLQLVLVGAHDYFYQRLKTFIEEKAIKNINLTGYIPDYDLDVIFHNAIVYVWPSLYEGFGLPPLEAMAKGTAVISSEHPCMREILGDAVIYFNGLEKQSMEQTMERMLKEKGLRENLIKKGYEQIKKYSWKKMAQETQVIYEGIK
ncbi:MAG: hypothetical protein COU40_00995 [Candidatus Moranbacteria bacterium CG10_big_fil_rev_8_21_14_0_10_35_21]|nr:MAG: hypothetical protein COU40_00995 [Candidatus Moranbacteria bacterium CG10_big_fil_rev_8_21_14_0_10_35_21]PJA88676.1 MAG: hypothetical protein CO139_01780 [Candidatus Moranbacteria bacterium CG_4_9_14_3_um_filter_36_9]